MKRVAIIGGGVSGLACAFRLTELKRKNKNDFEIFVFEAKSQAGGTIATEKRDGFIFEKGPDSFISEDPDALNFCRRLGIGPKVINTQEQSRKISVVRRGSLIVLPEGFYLVAPGNLRSFIKTPLFSLPGKVRMISEIFMPGKQSPQDESVGVFIRRRFGREALERVGQPMIGGIYSGDPERLSACETMPIFKSFERQYGSVIRGLMAKRRRREGAFEEANGPRLSLFLSFEEGMETLIRAMVSGLEPGTLMLGQEATELAYDRERPGWRVITKNGKECTADVVCSSISASNMCLLLKETASDLARKLNEVSYHSVATINFAYREEDIADPLAGSGFVVPSTERKSLTACTFSNRKFKNRAPQGHVVLRAFVGGAFGKKYYEMEDKELTEKVQSDLASLLGIKKNPLFWSLARFPRRMAQYRVGHKLLISEIECELSRYKGLFLTGCAYRGSGVPNAIKDGQAQAERIYEELNEEFSDGRG